MIYSIRVAFDLNVNAGENILAIFDSSIYKNAMFCSKLLIESLMYFIIELRLQIYFILKIARK